MSPEEPSSSYPSSIIRTSDRIDSIDPCGSINHQACPGLNIHQPDTLDYLQAFTFAFRGSHPIKRFALVGLIAILPVIGQVFILGWGLEITRQIITGEKPVRLPEIDFASQFNSGLQVAVIYILASLPALLILALLDLLASMGGGTQQGAILSLANISVMAGLVITGLYLAFIAILIPAAVGILAADADLRPALSIRNTLEIVCDAPQAYLVVFPVSLALFLLAQSGLLVCFAGIILTATYAVAVSAHLYGQAYNHAFARIPEDQIPYPPLGDNRPSPGVGSSSKDST